MVIKQQGKARQLLGLASSQHLQGKDNLRHLQMAAECHSHNLQGDSRRHRKRFVICLLLVSHPAIAHQVQNQSFCGLLGESQEAASPSGTNISGAAPCDVPAMPSVAEPSNHQWIFL